MLFLYKPRCVCAVTGGISVLADILLNGGLLFQRMAAAVLCHMTKNAPACEELVCYGAIPVLIKHLSSHHPELQSRCTVILTDLAGHSSTYQTQITELVSINVEIGNTVLRYANITSTTLTLNQLQVHIYDFSSI